MTGYIFTHEGKQYDPDGRVSVDDFAEHNRRLEATELAAWAEKPDRWYGYIDTEGGPRKLTTWLGTVLGTVARYHTYRDGFGNRMAAVTVRGTNGRTYYGRYGYDWSQLIRLRAYKPSMPCCVEAEL